MLNKRLNVDNTEGCQQDISTPRRHETVTPRRLTTSRRQKTALPRQHQTVTPRRFATPRRHETALPRRFTKMPRRRQADVAEAAKA